MDNVRIEFGATSTPSAGMVQGEPSNQSLRKKYGDNGCVVLPDETLGGRSFVHFKVSDDVYGFGWPFIYRERGVILNIVVTATEGGNLVIDDDIALWRRTAEFVRVNPQPVEWKGEDLQKAIENLRNGMVAPSEPAPKPQQPSLEVQKKRQDIIKEIKETPVDEGK